MSIRLARPALLLSLVAVASLAACANSPTAPTRTLRAGVRSADVVPDTTCRGGWAGSSRC